MNDISRRRKSKNYNRDYIRVMRRLRKDANMTQQQVADYLGTSQTMYARYERGANEIPLHHLIPLCKLFDVTAGQMLGLEELQIVDKLVELSNDRKYH